MGFYGLSYELGNNMAENSGINKLKTINKSICTLYQINITGWKKNSLEKKNE